MNSKTADGLLQRTLGWVALLLTPLIALSLIVAFFYGPSDVTAGVHLAALGLPAEPCPGCLLCGMSRAFAYAMRADWVAAWSSNPLVILAWPLAWITLMSAPALLLIHPSRR